jgi:SAM-dependent methyltransferase
MYSDGYSISDYGGMIRDERRFTPYLEALRRYVTPDTVMLDIGAGTGILSFLAIQLGARRVFAIEPDACIETAKLCARNLPGAGRITFIRDLSTNITLPEQADLVVGDLHGTLPFYTGNIPSLADARKRHLKPGGRLLPLRDRIFAAPATAPQEYRQIDEPWRNNALGLDLSAAVPSLVNRMWRARTEPIDADRFLAAPVLWGIVDYREAEEQQLDGRLEFQVERAGRMHGYYLWFDGEVAEGLGFSNSPLLPELVYGRSFLPLQEPVDVTVGDRVQLRLSVKRVQEEFVYRWQSDISGADGQLRARFRQSTFHVPPGQSWQLRKSEADYIPQLDEDGRVQRAILLGMDGKASLREIAQSLQGEFPMRFTSYDRALGAVVKVSQKIG